MKKNLALFCIIGMLLYGCFMAVITFSADTRPKETSIQFIPAGHDHSGTTNGNATINPDIVNANAIGAGNVHAGNLTATNTTTSPTVQGGTIAGDTLTLKPNSATSPNIALLLDDDYSYLMTDKTGLSIDKSSKQITLFSDTSTMNDPFLRLEPVNIYLGLYNHILSGPLWGLNIETGKAEFQQLGVTKLLITDSGNLTSEGTVTADISLVSPKLHGGTGAGDTLTITPNTTISTSGILVQPTGLTMGSPDAGVTMDYSAKTVYLTANGTSTDTAGIRLEPTYALISMLNAVTPGNIFGLKVEDSEASFTKVNTKKITFYDNGDMTTASGTVTAANFSTVGTATASRFVSTVAPGQSPISVTSDTLVTNLNSDSLDGYHEASFFKLADDETVTGVPNFNGGLSGATAPFTVDSTFLVTSLNADLLDGSHPGSGGGLDSDTVDALHASSTAVMNMIYPLDGAAKYPNAVLHTGAGNGLDSDLLDTYHESSFFKLADNETVTGVPAFDGGLSGATAPFTVDSTFLVTNLNADTVDGYNYNGLPYLSTSGGTVNGDIVANNITATAGYFFEGNGSHLTGIGGNPGLNDVLLISGTSATQSITLSNGALTTGAVASLTNQDVTFWGSPTGATPSQFFYDASLGSASVGYNHVLTGVNAAAVGESNTASGQDSFAAGNINTASGANSIAMGYQSSAVGNGVAIGYQSQANGGGGVVAIGQSAIASASYSQSFGVFTDTAGILSATIGVGIDNTHRCTNYGDKDVSLCAGADRPSVYLKSAGGDVANTGEFGHVGIGTYTTTAAHLTVEQATGTTPVMIVDNKGASGNIANFQDSGVAVAVIGQGGNTIIGAATGTANVMFQVNKPDLANTAGLMRLSPASGQGNTVVVNKNGMMGLGVTSPAAVLDILASSTIGLGYSGAVKVSYYDHAKAGNGPIEILNRSINGDLYSNAGIYINSNQSGNAGTLIYGYTAGTGYLLDMETATKRFAVTSGADVLVGGCYAQKMVNDTGSTSVVGTLVASKPFAEAGDAQNAFSQWVIDGAVIAKTNGGALYYSYATATAQPATMTIYRDTAGTLAVATCSHAWGGGAVACNLTALNSSGITGRLLVADSKDSDTDTSNNILTGVLVNGVALASTSATNPTDTIGVVLDAVANGAAVSVCTAGTTDALVRTSTYAQKGYFAIVDDTTAGRVNVSATATAGISIGSFIESCQPNSDETCKININIR